MAHDVTISYFIPEQEVNNLNTLCAFLTQEQKRKISKAEATRQAITYFADHLPSEIDIMPRAAYKRGTSSPQKVPFQLPPEMLEMVEKWVEDYSGTRNQVIRQALMDYAKYKGLEWVTIADLIEFDPAWKRIEIDAEIASLLSGMTKAVIHKYANMNKYRFTEELFGRAKRYFYLDEIVRFYDVPHEEVEQFINEGEEEYLKRRHAEQRRRGN